MDKHITFVNEIINTNKFYQKYYNNIMRITSENFSSLPVIEKGDIQKNVSELIHLSPKFKYEICFTSGTTGIPLKIYWSVNEFIRSNFYTWYLRKIWYGITPMMKYCTFHSCATNNSKFEMTDAILINGDRTLSLGRYFYNDSVVSNYINMINEFEASWILGPASVLYIISKFMLRNDIHLPNIIYIELNGEFVDSFVLKTIKKAFPNISISNLYGSTEFNGIAFSCPHGNMHILSENVYVESIIKNGYPCLHIIGLENTAMPLIRYNIGDVGEIKHIKCSCGNENPVLVLYKGRVNDMIKLNDNISMDPAIFNNIISDLNSEQDIVLQFQVKIISNFQILLILLIDEKYISIIEKYKNILINKLKLLNCKIEYQIKVVYNERDMMNTKNKFSFICYDKLL